MTSDSIILDAATKVAFSRGEGLVAAGSVTSWEARVRPEGGLTQLRGSVAERGGAPVDSEVSLDLGAGRVVDHRCSCGAPGTGLCKHGVALALTYLDALRTGRAAEGADASSESVGDPKAGQDTHEVGSQELERQTQKLLAQYRAGMAEQAENRRKAAAIQEMPTSPQVGSLVYAYSQLPILDAHEDDASPQAVQREPVELLCTLSAVGKVAGSTGGADDGVWEVRLRVSGGHQAYMVRRIDDLVGAWERGETRSYGRNLTFPHNRESFSGRANAVLEIVARILHSQEAARSGSRSSASTATFGVNPKVLSLSDGDAVELLDALQGAEIQFEPRGGVPGRPRTLTVTQGQPALALALEHGERGGYDLVLPAGVDCVLTHRSMYLLLDGCAIRCPEAYRARMGTFCRTALPASSPLHIREDDLAGFCATVLPVLKELAEVAVPDDLEVLLPPPAALSFKFSLVRGCVTCEAVATYGNRSVGIFEAHQPGQPVRDAAREEAGRRAVRRAFHQVLTARGSRTGTVGGAVPTIPWSGGELFGARPCFDASDTEALYRFLTQDVPAFAALGEVYLSESLRSISVRPAPRVRVEASIKSGLLDIAIDSGDLSPHDLLAYLASFERKERFVRLSDGDILRLDDGGVRAVAELAAGLGVSAQALVEGTEPIPMNRAPFVDAMMKRAECVRFDRDESFRSVIRDFDSIGDNDFVEPPGLRDVLRPYQRAGFKWISTLDKLGFGGILADDMGLGKTLQVIAFLLARYERNLPGPSLVVCPASLVYNWISEFGRFAPGLSVLAVAGAREERQRAISDAAAYDVLVTSYELLKRDVELYEGQRFYCQVLDEAQYIKNHSTQAARCAKRIRAEVRLALTGTPIENRLSELWSIFDYLMPGLLGSYEGFRRRFELPIAAGDEAAARRLQCMVGPFVLRRMKGDVLKDLPEKTESVIYAPLEGEQDELYRATASHLALSLAHRLPREFARDRLAVLAELTKLRQICCDPHLLYANYEGGSAKLEAAMDLVASAVDGGHKVLLFSQFTSMLELIAARLDEAGIGYYTLTGATSKEERARLVTSYNTDGVPVFLISLKAGGVGLNLTAADIVIHYDPWWNLAAQNQATDRAHRIGQTSTVTVFKLIAKGTIEEKILELQDSKRDLAESVLGGENVGTASLTKEDILALLDV